MSECNFNTYPTRDMFVYLMCVALVHSAVCVNTSGWYWYCIRVAFANQLQHSWINPEEMDVVSDWTCCQDVNVKRLELGQDIVVKKSYLVRKYVACIIFSWIIFFVRIMAAPVRKQQPITKAQLHILVLDVAAKVSVYLTYYVVVGNITSDSA